MNDERFCARCGYYVATHFWTLHQDNHDYLESQEAACHLPAPTEAVQIAEAWLGWRRVL